MPDLKLICEKCNSEKFIASSDFVFSETVTIIECAFCKHSINVNEVVTYREPPHLTLVPDVPLH